jgi:membrane-associated protein
MYTFFLDFYNGHQYLGYLLLTALSLFEGPIVSILAGSFVKLGYLNFTLAYIAVMVGDLIGDSFLYYLGYRYGELAISKVQKKFYVTDAKITKVKSLFSKYKYLVLFTSKLTNGFGFSAIVLLTAGIVRIPLFAYLTINIAAQLFWSGGLIFVGYHFIGFYQKIASVNGKIAYVSLILFSVVCVYIYFKFKKPKVGYLLP